MKFNVKAEMFYFSPLHELSAIIVDDCATRFSTRSEDEESDVSHGV
jgi:hypothetical protein